LNLILVIIIAIIVATGLIFMPSYFQQQTTGNQQSNLTSSTSRIAPGEYIIQLKPEYAEGSQNPADSPEVKDYKVETQVGEKAEQINETLAESGAGGYVDRTFPLAIQGFSVKGVENITVLATDPSIMTIEPNRIKPVDTQYQSTGIDRIDLDKAVTASYRPDSRETKLNIDIAVIDSQVSTHPDLNLYRVVRIVPGADTELESHGTHVAGICCARDNLAGVVGPAQGARIWSLVICGGVNGPNLCSETDIVGAANYIMQNPGVFEIATMSCCGGNPETNAARTAVTNVINTGVTYFRSAGNSGTQCQVNWGCDHPNAIVVSNMQDYDGKCGRKADRQTAQGLAIDDRLSPSSTWGSQIDLMAPGTRILSTYPAGVTNEIGVESKYPYIGFSEHGSYAELSGTSMATPLAAGIGALVKLNNPSFTPAQIKTDMQTNGMSRTLACDGQSKGGLAFEATARGTEKILFAGNE
jgi:subtilisin